MVMKDVILAPPTLDYFSNFPSLSVFYCIAAADWLLIAASLQPFINLRWQVGNSFIACIRWVKCKWNRLQILVFICICHPLHFFSSDTEVSLISSEPKLPYLSHSASEVLHIFLTLIILTDEKVLGVPRQIKPLQGKKKERELVSKENKLGMSSYELPHILRQGWMCCSEMLFCICCNSCNHWLLQSLLWLLSAYW